MKKAITLIIFLLINTMFIILPYASCDWEPLTTEVVSTESNKHCYGSSLGVGPDGTVHIAWEEMIDASGPGAVYDILYKKYVRGAGWTTTEVVSTESTESPESSWGPSLGVGPDGTVHIAWSDRTDYNGAGTDNDIFYRSFVPGSGWTTTEVVSTESTDGSGDASLGVGSDGSVHIAWFNETHYFDDPTPSPHVAIFCRSFVPGSGWTATELVSTESTRDSLFPSLGVGPDGSVHIAWYDGTDYDGAGTDLDIFYKKCIAPARIESCDAFGVTKNSYSQYEDVYVKGSGFVPSILYPRNPPIYVVEDTTWTDGMEIPDRISGTVTTVFSGASGDIEPTLVWSNPLSPGRYDIVVDENTNGYYDQSIDALDDLDIEFKAGFSVGGIGDGEFFTYGGACSDFAFCVSETNEGDYMIAGSKEMILHSYDAYLIKTDSSGYVVWDKTFGTADSEGARCIQQTMDEGCILAGYKSMETGDSQVYLIKTDAAGNMEWSNTYGNSDTCEEGYFVEQTTDGGYVVTGFRSFGLPGSQDVGDSQVFLLKVNSDGIEEWSFTYGGDREERGHCVRQTRDGGYIITGYTWSDAIGVHDVYLLKTYSDGSLSWEKKFGTLEAESGRSVIQTSDGGYLIAGSMTDDYGKSDVLLIRTDSEGNEIWNKNYGGSESDIAYSVQETLPDDGFVLAGSTRSFGAGASDVYVIKTDREGNLLWEKTYGGAWNEVGRCIKQISDMGFIVVGHTYSFGVGNADVFMIKIAPEFNMESVECYTGTGPASFVGCSGEIEDLTAVDEDSLPLVDKPEGIVFPDGLFSFTINGVSLGETVTVYIVLPTAVPVGSEYWKCHVGAVPQWFSIPIGSDDGDNIISISLTDGGLGDSDGVADGRIVDPGGLALISPPGWFGGISLEIILFAIIIVVIIAAIVVFFIKRNR
jgi:hypothetical protein